jgi:hypothetical protein
VNTGTSGATVDVYIEAVAGYYIHLFQGSLLQTGRVPAAADLLIIGNGHNDFNLVTQVDLARTITDIEWIAGHHPNAGVCIVSPNFRTDASAARATAAANEYPWMAALAGWEVNTRAYREFQANQQWISGDGIHPTSEGYQKWAEILADDVPRGADFTYPIVRHPTWGRKAANLIADPNFAGYSSGTPAGWTINSGSGTTFAKDSTNYEGKHGWSVRFIGSGAGQGGAYYLLNLRDVAGRWVTFQARIRIPTGNASTSGRLAILTNLGNATCNSSSNTNVQNQWIWQAISYFVEPAASYCRCIVYADTAVSSAEIQVDRVVAVLGRMPAFDVAA